MSAPPNRHRFPRAWWTYSLSALMALVIGLDGTGIVPCGIPCVAILLLLPLGVATLVRTPKLVVEHGVGGVLPILACVVVLPVASQLVQGLYLARFRVFESRYERVATAVHSGAYAPPLRGEDSILGFTVFRAEDASSVSFITISHGYAGHRGYLRAFGDESDLRRGRPPSPWRYVKPLGAHWYAVGE